MDEILLNVNWLAVITSTIVSFALGYLRYSPKMFGKKWAKGVGITLKKNHTPPVMAIITQLIWIFLLAWIVGITAVNNALLTIILITLTIVFLFIAGGLFTKRSYYAITTDTSFVVVMVIIMIIFQGVF